MNEQKKLIFIACGQRNKKEICLGKAIEILVDSKPNFEAFLAESAHDLDSLTSNIFKNLNKSSGLIAVMHKRDLVKNTSKFTSSVWINQEIAITSQAEIIQKVTTYESVKNGALFVKETDIEYKMYPVDEVAQELVNKIRTIDMDLGTSYSKTYPKEKINEVVKNSLEKIGEKKDIVSEENKQKTLQAFDTVYREATKTIRYDLKVKDILPVKTSEINKNVLGVASLRSDKSIFYGDNSLKVGETENIKLLKEIIEDDNLPKSSAIKVKKENFKTPLNLVFTSSKPEREFVKFLTREDNAKVIDCWIKSLDMGFYGIEYSWRKGEHPKVSTFNPDFFVKIDNEILVVEIKHDDAMNDTDPDFEENKAKLRYAREHFERLNKKEIGHNYYFKFLTPVDYDLFFQKIRNNEYISFKSKLEAKLEESNESKRG